MTSRPHLFLSSILFAWAAVWHPVAQAQTQGQVPIQVVTGGETIVYQLTFDPASESINYSPYENGYYVVPVQGGPGTLIVTKTKGTVKNMYVFTDFGELFVARNNGARKAVLTCTAGSDVSTTAFFAIGDASEVYESDTGKVSGDAYYAAELTGYTVSADSQYDQLFQGSTSTDSGVAGSGTFSAFYDEADSNNAGTKNLSVAGEVAVLQARLTAQGYKDASQTATGTGTGSGTGTATPGTGATDSSGDLVVYRLGFKTIGDSVNYRPFTGGYFVGAAVNGAGTLILELEHQGSKYYREYPTFGSLFVAKSRGDRKGVMSAMDANSVSSTTFFATGDANQSIKVDAPSVNGSINFARKLTGYAFSADSETDLAFFGDGSDIGVAGVSRLTATYLEDTSKLAKKNARTLKTEVQQLEKELVDKGFIGLPTTFEP